MVVVSTFLFIPYGQLGILLLGLLLFVSVVGLFLGLILGLGLTLILLFVIGSMIFWFELTNQPFLQVQFPFMMLFVWMALMILIALFSGYIHQHIRYLHKNVGDLEEQVRSLVSTDSLTGFDNKQRMFMELEVEYSRSKRYENTFSFLLLQVQHYEQFKKLYGDKELNNMIRHIAKNMVKITRPSDLRFRIEKDTFAIIFTNTPVTTMDIIIEKLNKELRIFQLENNKMVTMTFLYGYAGEEVATDSYVEIYEEALEQVSSNVV